MADDKKNSGLTYEGSYLNTDLFSDTQLFGSELGSEPYSVDTSGIDQALSIIDAPGAGDIYDKRAALYRQEVLGGQLRNKKNWDLFMGPTMNLLKKRNDRLNAKAQMEWDSTEKLDETNIFGELTGNEMPITDEIIAISKQVKADIGAVQSLSQDDPKRRELRRRIEANQNVIVQFNEVNKNLFGIRNDMESNGTDIGSWSQNMSGAEIRMWHDIYNSDGKNMKVVDDGKGGKKVVWDDPGAIYYEFGEKAGEDNYQEHYRALKKKSNEDKSEEENPLAVLYRLRNEYHEGGLKNQKDKEVIKEAQKALKELFPKMSLGTTGENGDGVDGDWGTKTEALYSKYFNSHKDLEKKHFNKTMSDHDKSHEYQEIHSFDGKVISDEIKEGGFMKRDDSGQYEIDLATITQTPPMREAEIMLLGIQMEEATLKLMQAGEDSYTIEKTIGVMYDGLDIQQQKSLLFDGADATGKEIDTNKFIESLMYAQGDDYDKMSGPEKMKAVDNLKGNGMLKMYINPKTGEEEPLNQIFKDFYMKEVSKLAKSGMPQGPPNLNKSGYSMSYDLQGNVTIKKTGKTYLNNLTINPGEITFNKLDIINMLGRDNIMNELHPEADGWGITDRDSEYNSDYRLKKNGVLQYYEEDEGKWKNSSLNENSSEKDNDIAREAMYFDIIEGVNALYGTKYKEGI